MRELNLKSKQKGVFSIEFAIIAVFFSLLLVFSGDVIIKLSVKGKLDRLSYSLVNIIKERRELYSENSRINSNEVNALFTIAKNSLSRTMSNFDDTNLNILVEEQTFSIAKNDDGSDIKNDDGSVVFLDEALVFFPREGGCSVSESLHNLTELSVVSVQERKLPLYRVTLCYETNDWIGSRLSNSFTTVSSSSVMVGRL